MFNGCHRLRAALSCRSIFVFITSLVGKRPTHGTACRVDKSSSCQVDHEHDGPEPLRHRNVKLSVHSELDRAMHTKKSAISHKSSHHVHVQTSMPKQFALNDSSSKVLRSRSGSCHQERIAAVCLSHRNVKNVQERRMKKGY